MVKRTTIFLADDDADDRLLLSEAIKSVDSSVEIVEAKDGQQLLVILQSQILPTESLIILDMNMPRMNGLETLANLRNNSDLAAVPAVILSTSGNADMIQFAKQLGAINYFVKPSSMDGLLDLSRQIIFGDPGTNPA